MDKLTELEQGDFKPFDENTVKSGDVVYDENAVECVFIAKDPEHPCYVVNTGNGYDSKIELFTKKKEEKRWVGVEVEKGYTTMLHKEYAKCAQEIWGHHASEGNWQIEKIMVKV